jgi:2-isopropylmalate synthase
VIRVNSQSGKGGCAWVLERELGIALPKPVQADVSKVVQKETDRTSKEILPEELCQLFTDISPLPRTTFGTAGLRVARTTP